jgi:outer membrane protein
MMKKLIISALLVFMGSMFLVVNAQKTIKIGHINSQELLAAMPESDSAQAKLEKIAGDHEAILEELSVEFNKKFEAYRVALEKGTLSDVARSVREGELQDLQTRIQTFEENARQDIQRKQVELLQPVHQKALDAVNSVAEEKGFTYIFDTGTGGLIYTSPDSEDLMPLVKAKLGIQ